MIHERKRAARPHSRREAKKRGRRTKKHTGNRLIVQWLIIFWPIGMFFLWPSRWKKSIKIATTAICMAMTVILVFGGMAVWDGMHEVSSGSNRVSNDPYVDRYGPVIPDGVTYSYTDEDIIQPIVVITPEPTEEPETAFVNVGGDYFHTEGCRFFKQGKSQAYYVPYLLSQGFGPCDECSAGILAAEYTGGQ